MSGWQLSEKRGWQMSQKGGWQMSQKSGWQMSGWHMYQHRSTCCPLLLCGLWPPSALLQNCSFLATSRKRTREDSLWKAGRDQKGVSGGDLFLDSGSCTFSIIMLEIQQSKCSSGIRSSSNGEQPNGRQLCPFPGFDQSKLTFIPKYYNRSD